MIIHWVCNDNTCVLTTVEKHLRKELNDAPEDCITCKLIEPVYDFKKNYNNYSVIIYVVTILLWLISVWKLYGKYNSGNIKKINDLFIL